MASHVPLLSAGAAGARRRAPGLPALVCALLVGSVLGVTWMGRDAGSKTCPGDSVLRVASYNQKHASPVTDLLFERVPPQYLEAQRAARAVCPACPPEPPADPDGALEFRRAMLAAGVGVSNLSVAIGLSAAQPPADTHSMSRGAGFVAGGAGRGGLATARGAHGLDMRRPWATCGSDALHASALWPGIHHACPRHACPAVWMLRSSPCTACHAVHGSSAWPRAHAGAPFASAPARHASCCLATPSPPASLPNPLKQLLPDGRPPAQT
jgi:hypothetical protein